MDSHYRKLLKLKSGKEILLRVPKLTDAVTFSKYINELVEEDTFISSKKQTVDEEREYIKSMLNMIKNHKEIHLIAVIKRGKIGAVDIFSQGVRKEHIGELQININKKYRGLGLGEILMKEAFQLAKIGLKLKIVILTCFSNNERALKLYKKFGFEEFGKLAKGIKYKNKLVDEIYLFKNLDK